MRELRLPAERWIFPGYGDCKSITPRQFSRLFREAVIAAGIRKPGLTLHSLRRSFATHRLERGTDIRIIQALLGHDKLETTARYTRVATGMIAAVESPLTQFWIRILCDLAQRGAEVAADRFKCWNAETRGLQRL